MDFNVYFTMILAVATTCTILKIKGDAEVLIRFEYFTNPEGELSNGHCCDGWPIRCETGGGCDYYFRICLDKEGGEDNTKSCEYGYHRSNKVANDKTSIIFSDFGESFGDIPNPLKFEISEPVDGRQIVLKIDVKDEDRWSKGDVVDYFSKPIALFKGIYPRVHRTVELTSRTRLLTAVTIQCAEGWYGEECTVPCEAPAEDDHYTCDLWTGEKICQPGWSGDNCSSRKRNMRRRDP